MKTHMINDYVLVKLIEAKTTTQSGFMLIKSEPPCIGTVISVGPGRITEYGILEEHAIAIGDEVVFGKSSMNTPLKDEDTGETNYVMKVSDIFGKRSS